MTLSKHKLRNGNVFIWLGKSEIWGKGGEEEGVDNVLILAGGEVLFLKTAKVLPLYEEKVREDLKILEYEEFIDRYDFPADRDFWKDLKEGVESGEYLAFFKKHGEKECTERHSRQKYLATSSP